MSSRSEAAGPPGRTAVMHLVDTLEVGGAERMAVNIVNALPRDRWAPHLCTTRRLGPLADALASDVPLACLYRRHRLDTRALRTLRDYIRAHDVRVLHAHGTALFVAVAAARLARDVAVVWHVHFGRLASTRDRGLLFRALLPAVDHTITVSQPLMSWARVRLGIPSDRISYVPNFVTPRRTGEPAVLAGTPGARIACVANFVPEKGHDTLLAAMARVAAAHPTAHLFLVGGGNGNGREDALRADVRARGLESRVSFLGQRRDVPAVLAAVDVGVLSSNAEGLPLALVEYGVAGLPAVVTDVGQCADVVGHGEAGVVVPPGEPERLAEALLGVLNDEGRRRELGRALRERVGQRFDRERIVARLGAVYERVAGGGAPSPSAARSVRPAARDVGMPVPATERGAAGPAYPTPPPPARATAPLAGADHSSLRPPA